MIVYKLININACYHLSIAKKKNLSIYLFISKDLFIYLFILKEKLIKFFSMLITSNKI